MFKKKEFLYGFYLILLVLFCLTGIAAGHGTKGAVIEERAFCVLFSYDDDEPMDYARVSILAPGTESTYQTGVTDPRGIICFVPDRTGPWQVTANDGMGHMQRLVVQVEEQTPDATPKMPPGAPTAAPNKRDRIVVGLGIIFGVAGLASLLLSRRRKQNRG